MNATTTALAPDSRALARLIWPLIYPVPEMEAIASELAQASATDDTLLAYTQSLLDAFRAQIVTRKGGTSEMAQLRRVIGT
jgi:hypothetical protein